MDETTPDAWDAGIAVNLKHQFFAARNVAADMRQVGGGAIVNFGSISWMLKQGGMPIYTTAKAAVQGLTRSLARDLRPFNIRVNTLVPVLSAVTVQELEMGVLLAERRDPLQGADFRAWFESQVLPAFAGRILPVDTVVAKRSAALHVPAPRPIIDSLIAATALVHGMTVVTRNVADFQSSGVSILNPWEAQ